MSKEHPSKRDKMITFFAPSAAWKEELRHYCQKRGIPMSRFCVGLVEAALHEDDSDAKRVEQAATAKMTATEVEKKATARKRLDELLDEGLWKKLEADPDWIKSLDDKTIAELAVRRAGKPLQVDEELQASALSLQDSLAHLPEVEDIDRALRRSRAQNRQLRMQLFMAQEVNKALGGVRGSDEAARWQASKEVLRKGWTELLKAVQAVNPVCPEFEWDKTRLVLDRGMTVDDARKGDDE